MRALMNYRLVLFPDSTATVEEVMTGQSSSQP